MAVHPYNLADIDGGFDDYENDLGLRDHQLELDALLPHIEAMGLDDKTP